MNAPEFANSNHGQGICRHGVPTGAPCRMCQDEGDPLTPTEVELGLSRIPEFPDSFSKAMARVEELREANRADLARRDRAEWECFFHFACENSLLKRQAE
jgi:hypothetical protein